MLTAYLARTGGVYSERLLRKDSELHSIHLQNAMLYVWGCAFNALALGGADGARIARDGLLQGYTPQVRPPARAGHRHGACTLPCSFVLSAAASSHCGSCVRRLI